MKLVAHIVLALLLLCGSVAGLSGHTRILAVSESDNGARTGETADLYLEIREGTGRVFLDTFPLTQITTQVSMRFAQQIACSELDIDCSNLDFVYTIRTPPGIVTGPSAGAAAAVLTAALLNGVNISNDVAITGTVNSGGLIGPVGGLQEKIEAAGSAGITTVLIPWGTKMAREDEENITDPQNESNASLIDLVQLGAENGVVVEEVATLREALSRFNGKLPEEMQQELTIDPRYTRIMEDIADGLCARRDTLLATAKNVTEEIQNLTTLATLARGAGRPYAASSFCFRTTIELRQQEIAAEQPTLQWLKSRFAELYAAAERKAREIDAMHINTITDVETYMAVRERLDEVIESANKSIRINDTDEAIETLAYLELRLASADSWAEFFEGADRKFVVDESNLRDSCQSKIAEAEERVDYVSVYFDDLLGGTRDTIATAYEHLRNGRFIRCLHTASMAKAEADIVLNLLGVEENRVAELLEKKLQSVRRAIAKAQSKGAFPLMSYAYYEYGLSLQGADRGSALLYAEYSLELSSLDMYFQERHSQKDLLDSIKFGRIESFALGIVVAFIIMGIISRLHRRAAHPSKRTRKRSR